MGSLYNPVTGGYDDTSSTYNPVTGGYMNTLAQIAAAAASGFSTYAKGSPSVATPRPLLPGSRIASRPGMLGSSSTNWLVIGLVVAVGIGALAWLVKAA